MKLAELKNKFKNKYAIRIIAGVLTVAVLGSSVGAYNVYAAKTTKAETKTEVSSETEEKDDIEDDLEKMLSKQGKIEEKDVIKDETVYIFADETGKANKTIVSEWLKNPESKDMLEDNSDLKDIANVKGMETFEQNGNVLTWKADGKDIYYQGTTKKEAPVTEEITYYLNDKEISPKDLAGKSGKVKIRFNYTNNEKKMVKVNGKNEEVYVPFVVVSGMMLDDNFRNISVENGKVISNGSGNMVVGVALPGIKESLKVKESDFSEDVSIPEYVEVTADVEDFSLGMTMSIVTSSSDLSVDGALDMSDLDEKIDDLTDAVAQLEDGSGELADGLDTLDKNLGDFSDGMNTLQSGITAYTNGAKELADGIGSLKDSSSALIGGVSELKTSVNTLNDGVKKLDDAVNTAMTDKEKGAAAAQAKTAAEAAVEAQFTDDKNPQSYNNIKAQAESTFADGITASKETVKTQVVQQAQEAIGAQADAIAAAAAQSAQEAAGAQADALVNQKVQEIGTKVQETVGSINIEASMPQEQKDEIMKICIGAATAQIQAQSPGVDITTNPNPDIQKQIKAVADAIYSKLINGINAGVKQQVGATVEGMVGGLSDELKNTVTGMAGQVAGETAKQVSSQVAGQVAGSVASSVVDGVAAQAKGTVGEAVAGAAKQAAKTAAGQAAGQAAVQGAESAKQQIAKNIEKKDEKSGHSLVSGMNTLNKAVGGMNDKMPTLADGINKLYDGSKTLASKNDELNNGMTKLVDGKNSVIDGVGKLAEGSHKLADGIVEFNEEGIEKLVNSYNGDVKDLVDRIQAVMDAGSEYESFGGKSDDVTGSVKFIMKTDAVKAEEK